LESPGFWDLLFGAVALMLVLEGLLPFFSPTAWRGVFERVTQMSDGQIRFLGLASMLAGLGLLRASGGGYEPDRLGAHRFWGLSVAVVVSATLIAQRQALRHATAKTTQTVYRGLLFSSLAVLVVTGLHDRVFRVEKDVAELAARIAKRREVVFADAGHLIPLERPEKFGKALLDFAAGL